MKTVIFAAPFPMPATLRFCQALCQLSGVRVVGLFQQPPRDTAGLAWVEQVGNALDTPQLLAACRRIQARFGTVHQLVGVLENMQEQLSAVRAELGLPGTDPQTARLFRDKATMKDALRSAGLPCARHRLLTHDAAAWSFVGEVGFPVVLKPPAGAGCKATYRVESADQLTAALREARVSPARPTLAEEFLAGREYSFETFTVGGEVRFQSVTHYLPTPLEATENPWVQWVVLAPRDISGPRYAAVRDVGPRVVKALGLDTSITHMEWFQRADGSIAVGEIAARPPGARIMDLMSWVYDRDFFALWAELMVHGTLEGPFERKYAAAAVFLRQPGRGRVIDVEGLEEAQKTMGHLVVDRQLPRRGQPKSEGYEGEGWVILRHPDTDRVLDGVRQLVGAVRVRYA